MIVGTIVGTAVKLSQKVGWREGREVFMPREVCTEVHNNFTKSVDRLERKIDRLLEANGLRK